MARRANQGLLNYGKPGLGHDGSKLIVGHVDGPFKGLGVRGAKRGCFAIGAVKQGISGSDTGIRRRFFVQHDLDKHVEGFNRVLARKLLDVVGRSSPPTSESRFLRRISERVPVSSQGWRYANWREQWLALLSQLSGP